MVRNKNLIGELKKIGNDLKEEIDAERVILFGSHAKGKAKKDSDVDIIVVSPRFRGVPSFMRSVDIRDEFYRLRKPVDIICLTPEEFEKKRGEISIIAEAVKEGKEMLVT